MGCNVCLTRHGMQLHPILSGSLAYEFVTCPIFPWATAISQKVGGLNPKSFTIADQAMVSKCKMQSCSTYCLMPSWLKVAFTHRCDALC